MAITRAVAGGRRAVVVVACRSRLGAALAAVLLGAAFGEQGAYAAGTAAPGTMIAAAANRTVEWVRFPDSRLSPVRIIRGAVSPSRAVSEEVVSFGTGHPGTVRVLRGISAAPPNSAPEGGTERQPVAVRLMRRMGFDPADLFSPDAGQLDRIAFAVDGIESRHGTDLRMWRSEPLGPQGPMQVSAKAAFDVGGGNRFDITENRLLGRAYLARMFRRYGNWPDALAAYNWGPGNFDQWVAAGRLPESLPDGVARYVALVLRDALVSIARW